jgi:hypothetical protein
MAPVVAPLKLDLLLSANVTFSISKKLGDF